MLSIYYVYKFFTSAIICIILVPYVSKLSIKVGGVDIPDDRKVHSHATPRLGGVAIFSSLLLTIILFSSEINQQLKGLLSGAIIVFLAGLADDLIKITPRQKFTYEFAAAGLAVLMGNICVTHLGNPFGLGILNLGPFAIPFTIIGIVGVINAINLLDGLDGLAGGVCTIVTVAFMILAYISGNTLLFSLSIILLGSMIGFLRYNNYPAQIFMGDSGSLLLGYFMGCFSVMLASGGAPPVSPYIPFLILGVPILDTVTVMVNRKRTGKRLFMPDKTHLHHRLLGLGVDHKSTVLILFGLTYVLCFIGIVFHQASDTVLLLIVILIYSAVYGLLHLLKSKGIGRPDFEVSRYIRNAIPPRTLIRYSGYVVVIAKFLVFGILTLPLFLSNHHSSVRAVSICSLVLFIVSIVVYLTKPSWQNNILQAYIYSAGFFVSFILVNLGRNDVLLGLPILYYSHGLFLLLMICSGMNIIIRKRSSKLLVSPFEHLILLIVLSIPLLPETFTARYHLLTVAAKSLIFFAGFRIILSYKSRQNRYMILVVALGSLCLAVRYLL